MIEMGDSIIDGEQPECTVCGYQAFDERRKYVDGKRDWECPDCKAVMIIDVKTIQLFDSWEKPKPTCMECPEGCDGELCDTFKELNKHNYPEPEHSETTDEVTPDHQDKKVIEKSMEKLHRQGYFVDWGNLQRCGKCENKCDEYFTLYCPEYKLLQFFIEHPIHKFDIQQIIEYTEIKLEVAEPILKEMADREVIEVIEISYFKLKDLKLCYGNMENKCEKHNKDYLVGGEGETKFFYCPDCDKEKASNNEGDE